MNNYVYPYILLFVVTFSHLAVYANDPCSICLKDMQEINEQEYREQKPVNALLSSCCSRNICSNCVTKCNTIGKCALGCQSLFTPLLVCNSAYCRGVKIEENDVFNHAPSHFENANFCFNQTFYYKRVTTEQRRDVFRHFALWYCNDCKKAFANYNPACIARHQQNEHGDQPDERWMMFGCTSCKGIVSGTEKMNFNDYLQHIEVYNCNKSCNISCKYNGAWVCPLCSEIFKGYLAFDIDEHFQLAHSDVGSEELPSFTYQCYVCKESNLSYIAYLEHVKTHVVLTCPDCPEDRPFPLSNAQDAINHYENHVLWRCSRCPFHNAEQSKVEEHIKEKHSRFKEKKPLYISEPDKEGSRKRRLDSSTKVGSWEG